ncbi:DUF3817 domain-containing protein [Microbacterium sp. CCH5-D1]|uniref:DUF3817 domain-containing protein n=1 Tax=Microbacterium sp. CCH5-D1 TaxID=1768780 RepID=UPI00076A684C|nr:DUF3817 domain-containing protein [Microbacterium sp. CCH5-D1]
MSRIRDIEALPGALRLYTITSIITGVCLLLLLGEIIAKHAFGVELELNGPSGFLRFSPSGTLNGVNLSTMFLIVHGWLYVAYLFANFRLWSLMKWSFMRFLIMALGGVVPLLSFFMEYRLGREVKAVYQAAKIDNAALVQE